MFKLKYFRTCKNPCKPEQPLDGRDTTHINLMLWLRVISANVCTNLPFKYAQGSYTNYFTHYRFNALTMIVK